MPYINTKDLGGSLSPQHTLWIYNALDAALTFEVRDAVMQNLGNQHASTYAFSKALQAPVLEMMRKGFAVDRDARDQFIAHLQKREVWLRGRLDAAAHAVWGKGLNPASPKAVGEFFYDALKMPEQFKRNKDTGERGRTTDREALEHLSVFFPASLFVEHILAIREHHKLASTLKSEVDADGRMRTSFNIAGTETGRFSSSSSAFNTGTNLQNQTERLRRIYRADRGKKLAAFDLKTGESFAVGLRCKLNGFGSAYLDACKGGDLHTVACKLVWKNLPWTGGKGDRAVAESPFYRHFTYRDMAKRGGHGTNYYGTPWTMAKHLKVDKDLIVEFQKKYFEAFPEIREWHKWVRRELQLTGSLTSIMGRERRFFGRATDDTTLREAIAYDPQSSIGDYTNQWLLRVHRNVPRAELLLQVHDALVVQFDEAAEAEVVAAVIAEAGKVRLGGDHPDSFPIPVDASTGWNWGKVDPKHKHWPDGNPFGLQDYRGRDDRIFKETSLLDRRLA